MSKWKNELKLLVARPFSVLFLLEIFSCKLHGIKAKATQKSNSKPVYFFVAREKSRWRNTMKTRGVLKDQICNFIFRFFVLPSLISVCNGDW